MGEKTTSTIVQPRTGYLPSLDGWRAIAVIAVIMDHDAPWTLGNHTNAYYHEYGGWGVYLFFAISGLLVCTRILQDEAFRGRFRLGDFYLRRFFRIQPPAFVYLIAIAFLTLLGITHERWSSILGALFLYQNYLFDPADVSGKWFLTGHFWTLAVEEHFYLLLSLLLYFSKRYRVRLFAGVLFLLYVYVRLARHFRFDWGPSAARHTEYNLQYLLVPALLALLLRRKFLLNAAERYLRPWVVFLATMVAKQVCFHFDPMPLHDRHMIADWVLLQPILLFYAFDFWVIATMLHPRSWTTRVLELKPLRLLGRWSYSIYLWHALFIVGRLPQVGIHAHGLYVLTERPWRYVATLAAALASFYLVENPMIRVGRRLAPPATPGHADLQALPTPVAS